MSGYKIINSDNEVINTINATLDFCEEAYPDHTYELVTTPELPAEVSERQWRDEESWGLLTKPRKLQIGRIETTSYSIAKHCVTGQLLQIFPKHAQF